MNKKEIYDVIIIGGGPAGCTASIYLKRKNFKVLLIEKNKIGGLMLYAAKIENYPAFKEISGIELAERIEEQMNKLEIKKINYEVLSIEKKEYFEIKTNKEILYSKTIILCTGTVYRKMGIKNEEKFIGKGLSYCATCDGPLFKGKDVAIIGGGNSAIHYALFLSEICKKVYVIHRSKFRADEILISKLKSKKNVEFKVPYEVLELEGNPLVDSIVIKNKNNNEIEKIKLKGIFVSIGQEPNTAWLKNLNLKLTEEGFIKVDENFQTSIPGIFAAGDITGTAGQIIIACGQGASAALSVASFLEKN